ncbi:MAG TPA: phosphoglycerate dehydrogenase [Sulfolobales archaeon]|nr:phosphoglycerate dehydrogenase [Sulfolobales archaeon]
MERYRIAVTYNTHPDAIKILEEVGDVVMSKKLITSEEELIELARNADALMVVKSVEPVTERVIENAPRLRIIARVGVGYDNVNVKAATRRGIWVTIAPVNSVAVAEHTLALIFSLARKIPLLDRHVRSGLWYRTLGIPQNLMGVDLWGKVLGIIGLGRIGREVALRARCLGMKILYYDIVRRKDLEEQLGIEFKNLEDLLRESDFVSIHTPLTEETRHMIDEEELRLMKPTAYLINTSRGAVVNTKALVRALKEGWIAGAALDVFEEEPLHPDNELTKLDNVILTPHAASYTAETSRKLAVTAAEEIVRVLRGDKPLYPVNQA